MQLVISDITEEAIKPNDFIKYISINQLDKIYNGECDSIKLKRVIDHVHINDVDAFLEKVISKLAHGGEIHITGVDQYEVAKGLVGGQIDSAQFNHILFSPNKNGVYNLFEITNKLMSSGISITYKNIDGYNYSVKGIRP